MLKEKESIQEKKVSAENMIAMTRNLDEGDKNIIYGMLLALTMKKETDQAVS